MTEIPKLLTPPHAYQDPTGWIKRLVAQHDRLIQGLFIPREEGDQLDEDKHNALQILSSRVHETLDLLKEFDADSQPKNFADLGIQHYTDDSGNDTVRARSPRIAADRLQDALRKAAWELEGWEFWLQEEGASSDHDKVAELMEVIDAALKAITEYEKGGRQEKRSKATAGADDAEDALNDQSTDLDKTDADE